MVRMNSSGAIYVVDFQFSISDNDNNYHLCEVQPSLINEEAPLNDFDQTLVVNGLTNGTQLTMRSGSVAPKNHVRLKVFRIIDRIFKPPEASKNMRFFIGPMYSAESIHPINLILILFF